jgi:penicillin-binding protein 1B
LSPSPIDLTSLVRRLAPRVAPERRLRTLVLAALGLAALVLVLGFIGFALRLGALRERRATGPSWVFPARVYSDGFVLEPGRECSERALRAQLAARGYRSAFFRVSHPGQFREGFEGFEILLRGFLEAPDPAGRGGPERVRVRLEDGRIGEVRRLGGLPGAPAPDLRHAARLEPLLVGLLMDEHRVRRTWLPLSRVPQALRDAVIAAEDRRFRSHFGIDLRGNLRALAANLGSRSVRQGGSTITQQLARGLFLGNQRTLVRKVREAFLAVGLEILLSKDQILEMYLNSVYWGQDGTAGIGGVAEAARFYFDLPVESLGVAEAAALAGIIPAPNVYSPFRSAAAARARRDAVLRDMVEVGVLDSAAAQRLARAPVRARRGAPPPARHPSFTGWVRERLHERLPRGAAEGWGLAVMTTLDPVWQAQAERGLATGVADQERWRGRGAQPLQGAFVAIENSTGAVRAMVGGRVAREGAFNRVTRGRRQPGSAIKPIVYAAALDPARGAPRLTPASTVPDLRREFRTPQGPWKPQNNEGDYHERVTLAKALARSLNVATANLVERIGPATVVRYGERFGLPRLRPVASIGLGTSEVTPLALVNAYTVFANGGVRRDPTPLRAVLDARGRDLAPPRGEPARVLSETTAALMTGLLEDVVIFGVGYPLRARFGFQQGVAGKTGTTNDHHDTWFVGFTRGMCAGVWVGFDTPQSLGRPASDVALPVWAGIVAPLTLDPQPPAFPERDDLETAWIDPWSGGLAREDCPSPMRVPFPRGAAPREACALDHVEDWQRIFIAEARAESIAVAQAADSTDSGSFWPFGP